MRALPVISCAALSCMINPLSLYAQHYGPGMMDHWGMGWLGVLLTIVFWILVIAGVIVLVKWLITQTRSDSTQKNTSQPLEILKERYARGEIDKQEFEEKKKDLL